MSQAPSNFSFLQAGWPELATEALRAEKSLASDPRAARFYARRTLELVGANRCARSCRIT